MTKKPLVIQFYRDYKDFTGGHLKVFHYFQYLFEHPAFKPRIYFTPGSDWMRSPWCDYRDSISTKWEPESADILFLAGMDWLALSEPQQKKPPAPVINFIQGMRHASPSSPLYKLLSFPATRVCVSQAVADVVLNTGRVEGALVVSPCAIDISVESNQHPDIDLLIVGGKQPVMAKELEEALSLSSLRVCNVDKTVSRGDFVKLLKRSRMAIFLPLKEEGFYLPPLEAMALGVLVICPDCFGNREYYRAGSNCIVPDYSFNGLLNAIQTLRLTEESVKQEMLEKGRQTAALFNQSRERHRFYDILNEIIERQDL